MNNQSSKRKFQDYKFERKKVKSEIRLNQSSFIFNQHKRKLFDYNRTSFNRKIIKLELFNTNVVCTCDNCILFDKAVTNANEPNENLSYSNNFDFTIYFDHTNKRAARTFYSYIKENILTGMDKIPPHKRYPNLFYDAWYLMSIRERIMYINRCDEEVNKKLIRDNFIGSSIGKLNYWFRKGINSLYDDSYMVVSDKISQNLFENNTIYEREYGSIVNFLAVQVKYLYFDYYRPLVKINLRSVIVLEYLKKKLDYEQLFYLAKNITDLELI